VALAWLRGSEAGGAGRAFSEFLERHGHRAVRELALHQPGWIDDPLPLVVSLRAQLLAGPGSRRRARSKVRASWMTRAVVAFAHGAIRQREHSKSMLVGVVHHFKRAYRHLAHLLRSESLLDDPELIFFLTHQELGRLAVHGDRALATRAVRRREAYRVQQTLQFPDVCVGAPEPLAPETHPPLPEGGLQGKPVSRGVVEGLARVVRGFAEADTIRAGEILVAPLIDVGWSPYYGILGGLATELGSPMSHGAVVAREHGLPTVTNLRDATRVFRTGDRVVLDGDRGVLRRVDDATSTADPRRPSPVAPERGELSCP
jgi:pyruvate,water dikinase